MKTVHTFGIVDETEYQCEKIFPETDMKICSEASLNDMLEAFERFLQAVGYVLPDNSYLDFVEDTSSFTTKYEGEF
jgi:hypothetical protein